MKPQNTGLTPVQEFKQPFQRWWAKRDDIAYFINSEYPSGAKWRQYLKMMDRQKNGPLIVGCSATSAMQVYVAAAGHLMGRRAVVFTPQRKLKTPDQQYAEDMGAEVNYIPHGYLSVVRAHMKRFAKTLNGPYVHWDANSTILDIIDQCENIPTEARRIVVTVGSGLVCAGILAGLAKLDFKTPVVGITVSGMADRNKILNYAMQTIQSKSRQIFNHDFTLLSAESKYDTPALATLPNGAMLDPYYAAKARTFVKDGDLFWVPGIRPLKA